MEQAWINALIGGGLIGLSTTIHLLFSGRVTGISGIFFGVFESHGNERLWRLKLVIGLLLGGILGALFVDTPFINETGRSKTIIVVAGFLVGFGTRLGSGCTSGHGVCGISRLSPRSILATLTFIFTGVLTVTLLSKISGGV